MGWVLKLIILNPVNNLRLSIFFFYHIFFENS